MASACPKSKSGERVELDSHLIKIHVNLNSQRNEHFEIFCQETYDFQNLRKETSFIADYEYVRKSTFGWLAATLWLKESTILWNVRTFE